MNLAPYHKTVAAVVGVLAEAVAAGVLHGNAEAIARGVIAAATVAGVYTARNVPAGRLP